MTQRWYNDTNLILKEYFGNWSTETEKLGHNKTEKQAIVVAAGSDHHEMERFGLAVEKSCASSFMAQSILSARYENTMKYKVNEWRKHFLFKSTKDLKTNEAFLTLPVCRLQISRAFSTRFLSAQNVRKILEHTHKNM